MSISWQALSLAAVEPTLKGHPSLERTHAEAENKEHEQAPLGKRRHNPNIAQTC